MVENLGALGSSNCVDEDDPMTSMIDWLFEVSPRVISIDVEWLLVLVSTVKS